MRFIPNVRIFSYIADQWQASLFRIAKDEHSELWEPNAIRSNQKGSSHAVAPYFR